MTAREEAAGVEEASGDRRIRILVRGIVQGVGFRPFLHRLARKHGLTGWARNTSGGLEAELEGNRLSLSAFVNEVQNCPPPMAAVEEISVSGPYAPAGYGEFSIRGSYLSEESTLLSPDMAPCPTCEQELFSPKNRRHRYPFLNCTDCGPRYTIVRALPYDRKNTVMDRFPMCPACRAEYRDIGDRRYHAQPNCCSQCGPTAFFLDAEGNDVRESDAADDPVVLAQHLLARGGILAVKGTGGIHLACDARNAAAVARLRRRKKSAGTASGRDVQGSGYSGTYLPSFPGGKAAFDLSPPPHSAGPEAFPPGFPRRQFQPPSGAFAALYPAPSAPDGSGLRRAGSSGDDQRQRFRLPRPHRQRRSRFDPFGDRGRISAPRPPYRKPL